jgi:predicted nucleic acid-binding protein
MSAGSSASVVDANVILRYLLQDDERLHRRAREFFARVREGQEAAYFPDGVIAECIYVLEKRYGVPRDEIGARLMELLAFRGVDSHNRALLQAALALYRTRKVDFIDAVVVATARERGWGIFSFDRDLERLGK